MVKMTSCEIHYFIVKVGFGIFFFIIILIQSTFLARTEEKIEMVTDRPDQTESASIILPGFVQVETGILFSSFASAVNIPRK